MSKASPSKHHAPKTVRVAQKHLAKPERQNIDNTNRKTRPIRSAHRREILQRLQEKQSIRRITSELGISQATMMHILASNKITMLTGEIELFKLVNEGGAQAAAILIDGLWFSIPAAIYAEFSKLLNDAFSCRLPVFVIAEWQHENFVALHLKEGTTP